MSAYELVARHVAVALKEVEAQSIARDVVARCLLSEAIRLFRLDRPIEDIAAWREVAVCGGNFGAKRQGE
jgi:hypothetical protein